MDRMQNDPAKDDLLVLVDGLDRIVGTASKEEAHREGLLHRAFSAVLIREGSEGREILLSKRAEGKYHSAGLWANSCCSHPRQGEELADAVSRRIREELGCGASGLKEIGSFMYRAEFPNGIVEYEYDHVFVGMIEGKVCPEPDEVSETRWITAEMLACELREDPRIFSAWAYSVFSIALKTL